MITRDEFDVPDYSDSDSDDSAYESSNVSSGAPEGR